MNTYQTDTGARLHHMALFYRGAAEYLAAAADFLREGVEAGERVLAAVPADKHAALRARLGEHHDKVEFADMLSLGRDPASLMPALRSFVGSAGRARVLGEPIWPGRTQPEICAATRHEALINVALGHADVSILCPYDATGLPIKVIADACRTHPVLRSAGRELASLAYTGPSFLPAGCSPDRPASQEPA
ncbi:MAG TPA: MEDS domain-containing protein [Streptosporangiaceae bacterium]